MTGIFDEKIKFAQELLRCELNRSFRFRYYEALNRGEVSNDRLNLIKKLETMTKYIINKESFPTAVIERSTSDGSLQVLFVNLLGQEDDVSFQEFIYEKFVLGFISLCNAKDICWVITNDNGKKTYCIDDSLVDGIVYAFAQDSFIVQENENININHLPSATTNDEEQLDYSI